MGGLWCAEEQPPMFQYLRPIRERVKALETEGPNGKLYIYQPVWFGCCVCKEDGMMVKVGRGSTRVYKYSHSPTPLRNHEESYELGRRTLVQEEVCILY